MMLLLLGLMGVLAVGATALLWLETSRRSEADPETAEGSPSAAAVDDDDAADADGGNLVEVAEGLVNAVPTNPPPSHIHEMDDPFMGGGWLEDDDDDDDSELSVGEDPVLPAGPAGIINDTPVVFDAVLPDDAGEVQTDALHPALMQDHQDIVADFLPDHDRLVIVFDDGIDPDPEVGIETDDACSHVTLNGVRIATVDVTDGLTLDHIALVPESGLRGPDHATPESAAA